MPAGCHQRPRWARDPSPWPSAGYVAVQQILGRWGGPEEVARTIVFLASPASSYTTGTNVVIDGGYTKRVQF